jgi:protein-tyrosine phosphatase
MGGAAATLPPPREPGRYRIAMVCLGNICRSPMAHVVVESRLAEAGLDDVVEVTSAGTGGWHEGGPMDDRAATTLTAAGYDATLHRARTFDPAWHDEHDLVLVMDLSNLQAVGGAGERTMLFRTFDPEDPGGEVPDPYYGELSGYEEVLRMVERTSTSLVATLRQELSRP